MPQVFNCLVPFHLISWGLRVSALEHGDYEKSQYCGDLGFSLLEGV